MDVDRLPDYCESRGAQRLENPETTLAEMLAAGKIVGVLQGRSELGPRALGNRSILCDPRDGEMKRRLNETVKRREWFRPFAPVVREGEQGIYFDVDRPVPYMSILGYTRPEWRSSLAAITHVDGSARLQTVNREQNPLLWRLLGEMKRVTGIGVLLNTSFNSKGEPMINEISDALRTLDQSGIDAVYCEGWLFENSAVQRGRRLK